MQQLKLNCYDVLLQSCAEKKLKALPKSTDIRAALGAGFEKSFCSDLFVMGYSYKPVDLAANLETDDEDYRLLKTFKKATYMSDNAKEDMKKGDVISLVKNGNIYTQGGYIRAVTDKNNIPVSEAILPDTNDPFGIRIQGASFFRFFLKTEKNALPEELVICGCAFRVKAFEDFTESVPQKYIIQCDLVVCDGMTINENSESRYKIAYDDALKKMVILAGSIVSREDFFGETIDFIPAL